MRARLVAAFVLLFGCGGGADVVRPPPPLAYRPPRLDAFWPNFVAQRLPNGAGSVCNADPGLPLVSVSLALRGGTAIDPVDRAGLSRVLARSLVARTRKLNPRALAVAQDFIGSPVDTRVDPDGVYLEVQVLEDRVLPALSLLAELVTNAAFNQADVSDAKAWVDVQRHDAWSDPDGAAEIAFDRAVFGADHPLGQPVNGTAASLVAITHAEVATAARQRLRPDGATIAVAGRVSSCDEVKGMVARLFGGWALPTDAPPLPTPPPLPPIPERKLVYVVPKPGLVQTHVQVGRSGLPRREVDAYILRQLFRYVAGRASSRLREVETASYGLGSRSSSWRDGGTVAVSGSVHRDYVQKALDSIMLSATDLEEGELPLNLYGVIAGEAEAMYPIVGRAHESARLAVQGLAPDYVKKLAADTDGIRSMPFNLVARRTMTPKLMQVVLVGDPDAIKAQLARMDAYEFGRVRIVEPF